MSSIAMAVSGVGAGISQGRFQSLYQAPTLKDQGPAFDDVGAAALHLLQSALRVSDATGHDLDVLA